LRVNSFLIFGELPVLRTSADDVRGQLDALATERCPSKQAAWR